MQRLLKYIFLFFTFLVLHSQASAQCSMAISSQPSFPEIVCAGPGSQRLSVTASIVTGGTLSYQWFFNGVQINAATSSSYVINTLQSSSNGSYSVVVRGVCGTNSQSLTSNIATLQVANTPLIVTSPENQSVCIGTALDLNVLGNSRLGGSLTYEWKNVNTNEVVSTNAAYSISSFASTNESPYSVTLSNTCGSVSKEFSLTKKDKPKTIAITSTTVSSCVGSSALLETQTTENNGGAATFEWYKILGTDPQIIPEATLSYLSFPSVSNVDAGTYRVFSRNSCGRSLTPLDFTLSTPKSKPSIVAQPSYTDINCANYELKITTTGNTESGSLNFSWRKDGQNVSSNVSILSSNSGKTSTLSILEPATSDNGSYQVFISNGCGTVSTNPVQVRVNVVKPVFVTQPASAFICENSAFSSEPFIRDESLYNYTYAWYKTGIGSSISASKKLNFNSFLQENDGTYELQVTDACGTLIKSNQVSFRLVKNPVIVTQPSIGTTTVCMNQDVSLQVAARQEFSGTLEYQWFNNDNVLNGEINNRLNLNKVTYVGQGSYRVQLKNQCGITQSNAVPINLGAAPSLVNKTSDSLFCIGSKMVLNVDANTNNGGQLRYRWTSSTTGLLSNETATYTINSFEQINAATYQIQISNSCGSIADPVNIKVSSSNIPIINSFSASSTDLCAGNSLDFNVETQGVVTTYRWFKSGTQIGIGNTYYQIPQVSLADAGNYKVTATNACGSSSSNEIAVTVKGRPTITKQPEESINCTTDRTLTLSTSGISNGGGAILYQWYKNGNALGTGTGATISYTGIDESFNGIYTVVLSNSCGSTNSESANVVIDLKVPEILQDPQDKIICAGSPLFLTLKIKDQGTKVFNYQWIKDGVDISGATSSGFSRDEAMVTHQGQYRVRVTGLCGLTALSSVATVNVNAKPNPNFTIDSKTSQCLAGNSFEFTDISIGTFNREWIFDDGNSRVNVTNVKHTYQKDGIYAVMLKLTSSNGCSGTITKNITVATIPSIFDQLKSQTACLNGDATLSVNAGDNYGGTINYVWKKDNSLISWAPSTTGSLNLTGLRKSDEGYYIVTISNSCGSINGDSAYLQIADKPVFLKNIPSKAICENSVDTVFTNATSAMTSITYQWYRNDQFFKSTNVPYLPFASFSDQDAGTFYVTAQNSCGTTNSNTFPINIKLKPIWLGRSFKDTTCFNETKLIETSFSSNLDDIVDLQWYKNDTIILGEKSNRIMPVINQDGDTKFRLIATNSCGSVDKLVRTTFANRINPQFKIDTVDACRSQLRMNITNNSVRSAFQLNSWKVDYGDGFVETIAITSPATTYRYSATGFFTVSLTARDESGCESLPVLRTFYNAEKATADFSFNDTCYGIPVEFTNRTKVGQGNFGIASLIWRTGNGVNISDTSSSVKYLYTRPGIFPVTMIARGRNSCEVDSITKFLTIKSRPEFFVDSVNGCRGELSVTIKNRTFSPSIDNYLWNIDFGDGFVVNNLDSLTPEIRHDYKKIGKYPIKITSFGNQSCQNQIINSLVYNYGKSIANFRINDTCNGNANTIVNLATKGFGIEKYGFVRWKLDDQWVEDSSLQFNFFKSKPGRYQATMYVKGDNNCLIDSISKTFTVVGNPNFLVDTSDGCMGELKLNFKDNNNSPNFFDYNWYVDFGDKTVSNRFDSSIKSITHKYVDKRSYDVKVFSQGSLACQKIEQTFKIFNYGKIKANFAINDTCNGFENTIRNISEKGFGNEKYQFVKWNLNGQNFDDTSNVFSRLMNAPGMYDLSMYALGSNSCLVDTITKRFYVAGVPIFKLDTADACKEQLKINVQNTNHLASFVDFKWTVNSGDGSPVQNLDSSNASYTYAYKSPGKYTVNVTSNGKLACLSQSKSYSVFNYGRSKSNFSYLDTCLGSETSFINSSLLGYGSDSYSIYRWIIDSDTSLVDPTKLLKFKFNLPGLHRASLITMGNKSCITDTMQLTPRIVGYPTANFGHIDSCANFNVLFVDKSKAAQFDTLNQWQWFFQDGSLPSFIKEPTHVFKKDGSYKVNLTVQSKACPSFVDDTTININIIRARENSRYTKFYSVQGKVNTLSSNPRGRSYQWIPQFNLNNATISSPILNPDFSKREYLVRITDSSGCINTDSLLVYGFKQPEIYLPTAFSPNLDGNNDLYKPEYVYLKSLEYFIILDQFNNKVFETKDFSTFWNGTFNGKIMPTGTYLVVVSGIDIDGNRIQRKNSFILLR